MINTINFNLVALNNGKSAPEGKSSTVKEKDVVGQIKGIIHPLFLVKTVRAPAQPPMPQDDPPIIITNEAGQKETQKFLEAHPLVGNTFIGVSCFCSLNMVAVRDRDPQKPLNLVILDKSIRVKQVWVEVSNIVLKGLNRIQTILKIEQYIYKHSLVLFMDDDPEWEASMIKSGTTLDQVEKLNEDCTKEIAETTIFELKSEIKNGESWLSDDTKFERVKKIFCSGRFHFFQIDLSNDATTENFLIAFQTQKLALDSLYISNIEAVLGAKEKASFLKFIKNLRTFYPQALIIDAVEENSLLTQRVLGSPFTTLNPQNNHRSLLKDFYIIMGKEKTI